MFDPALEPVEVSFQRAVLERDGQCHHGYVPRVIRNFRDCIFLPPAGLSPGLLQRRVDRMVDDHLPFPRYRPVGLCGPEGGAQTALHVDAANTGLVMVCPHALLLGLLFALACALSIVMSFARSGEVRQIVRARHGWTVRGRGMLASDAFLSIPKGQSAHKAFRIAPLAFRAIAVLMQFRFWHGGQAVLANCEPSRDLSRKCKADIYVFAHQGRMLDVADLNYLLAVLFAGVARVRTHDLRHAAATRASAEGATDEVIADWMNVSGWCVADYASDDFAEEDSSAPPDEAGEAFMAWSSARTDSLVLAGVAGALVS